MRALELTARITEDGVLTVAVPGLSPGEHRVVIVIEDQSPLNGKRAALQFSSYPVGPVSYTHLTLPTICSV